MFTSATSEIARQVDHAMLLIGGVSLVLLIGITLAMIAFAVRFRRARVRTTSQKGSHTGLEIAWTIVPTAIVIWMFFVAYGGFELMRRPPEDALVVEVTGKRWVWAFHYPAEGVDAAEMVVPVGKAVKVDITATPGDVLHSFFIPEFRVKEDARPGHHGWLWFQPEEKGEYHIFCAEFCGKDHSRMMSTLRVVSEADYRAWLKERKAERNRPMRVADLTEKINDPKDFRHPEALVAEGARLFGIYCAACHGAEGDGSGLPGIARNFRKAEGWKRSSREVDIMRTLTTGIEGTQMGPYPNLSAWQKLALARRVQGFAAAPTPSTPAEFEALIQEYGLDKVEAPRDVISVERAMTLIDAEERR